MYELKITGADLVELAQNLFDVAGKLTAAPTSHAPAPIPTTPVAQATPIPAPAPAGIPNRFSAPATTTPVSPVPVAPPTPPVVPTTPAPGFTVEQISNAGAALVQAGKMADLMALLGQYGVQAVTELKPEQYGPFATALRGMGANI